MKKEFIIERQGKQFVLYAGLLEEAHSRGLQSIETQILQLPSPDNGNIAVAFARVTMNDLIASDGGMDDWQQKTFTGIGDASHENVAPIMRQHIIRMAETRAKARALRDAVNVGVASLEESGDELEEPQKASVRANGSHATDEARTAAAERDVNEIRYQPASGNGAAVYARDLLAGATTKKEINAAWGQILKDKAKLTEPEYKELYGLYEKRLKEAK